MNQAMKNAPLDSAPTSSTCTEAWKKKKEIEKAECKDKPSEWERVDSERDKRTQA